MEEESGGLRGGPWQNEAVGARSRAPMFALTPLNPLFQELVFFPKEKMTDSEVIKLTQALKAPGMSDAALRAVSIPAANLAAWLWAVLRYGLAQRRGLPTGLLLRQIEATLAREQARLDHHQFQAQETREHNLDLAKALEEAQASNNHMIEKFSQAQCGQYHKWPIKAALLTPMHSWTTELQVSSPSRISPQSSFLHPSPQPLGSSLGSPCHASLHLLPHSLSAYILLAGPHALCSPVPPEVEGALPDCVRRRPPVFGCHHLPGSFPASEAPGANRQVAGSV